MPVPEISAEYSLPIAEIQAKLRATHQIGRDPVLGAKHDFVLADGRGALEVFPTAGITRVDTPSALIQVAAQPRLATEDGEEPGITLDLSQPGVETALTLHPDGAILFSCVPDAPERSRGAGKPTSSTSVPPMRETTPADHHRPADVPADAPAPQARQPAPSAPAEVSPTGSATASTTETEPRVQLTGRLGRTPTFRTSPRGTQIGSFSLAVHREDGSTVWHSIVAFGTRAEQLKRRAETGELTKGQEIDVVGYPHTREMPTKNGTRTVTEIHAAAVVKRG